MKEYNILGEKNIDLKHHFNECSTDELINEFINELKRICKNKKNEEVSTHDIELAYVILCILAEREEI